MNVATLGTVITFAKFIFLPHQTSKETRKISSGFWLAMVILLTGLIVASSFYYQAYTLTNIIKPLVTIGIGWLVYFLIFNKLLFKLPRVIEELDHLIGVMSLVLILVFWIVQV